MRGIARESALAAFFGQISASGITAWRNRRGPIDRSACPCANVIDGGHSDPVHDTATDTYSMTVTVEGFVATATDEQIGPAISQLYGLIADVALSDPGLGGTAIDVAEGEMTVDTSIGDGVDPLAAFSLIFTISYSL